jgi:hypothetical protein
MSKVKNSFLGKAGKKKNKPALVNMALGNVFMKKSSIAESSKENTHLATNIVIEIDCTE